MVLDEIFKVEEKKWWMLCFGRTGKIQVTVLERMMEEGKIRKVLTSLKHGPTLILPVNFPCIREH